MFLMVNQMESSLRPECAYALLRTFSVVLAFVAWSGRVIIKVICRIVHKLSESLEEHLRQNMKINYLLLCIAVDFEYQLMRHVTWVLQLR